MQTKKRQIYFLNCSSKKEMVTTTEDTAIVISPSPTPKEEDVDLAKELISTTDKGQKIS